MKNKQNSGFNLKKEIINYTLEKIQTETQKMRMYEADGSEDDSVIEILDNAYVNREGTPLAMDIFKPNVDEKKELPVIIHVHGGGLVMGDRKMVHPYARQLAKRGYLVFAIEYRLAPRANVCDELDDVCAGMDLIGEKLVDFNVDFTRIFLTADSAGAYLSVYVATMKKSIALQEAIGHEPSRTIIRALGLFSGMFYTNKKDLIGNLLSDQYYGDKAIDANFLKYMDPENKEILNSLPPVFLVTSRGDFLNQYTLSYHSALKKNGNTSHLQYYGSYDLEHSFVTLHPSLPESSDAIEKMLAFFEKEARIADELNIETQQEKERLEHINKRIASKEIANQTAASFIRELNSYSETALRRPALELGYRTLNYRQMFARWDKYSEIFSGLGITQANGSRVGLISGHNEISITLFYALNQMNVSVSFINTSLLADHKKILDQFKAEGITDLIALNHEIEPGYVKDIRWISKHAKLRHRIAVKVKVADQYNNPIVYALMNKTYHELLEIDGFVRMKSLIRKYEATPIKYGEYRNDPDALIMHTTGTTKGIAKPVPLSSKAINSAVLSLMQVKAFQKLRGKAKAIPAVPLQLAFGLIDQIHILLASSGELLLLPMTYPDKYSAGTDFGSNIIFAYGYTPEMVNKELKKGKFVDFSRAEVIILGGFHFTKEAKKNLDEYFAAHGAKVKSMVGYGLSEASGACILPDEDEDYLGKPLPGITLKIQDERDGQFYDTDDGVHTGGLFISGDQVSEGRIGKTTYFDLAEVDGKKYLATNDAVASDGQGNLSFVGRTNRYFANNEGIRFDESLIETALSTQKGIIACVMAPRFNKTIHDTVPVLYVEHKETGEKAVREMTESLKKLFIDEGAISKTNLPSYVVFTKNFTYTASGKIDVYAVRYGKVKGSCYAVIPVRKNGNLTDIEMVKDTGGKSESLSIPEEIINSSSKSLERNAEIMRMAAMLDDITSFFETPLIPKPIESEDSEEIELPPFAEQRMRRMLHTLFRADETDHDYED